MFLKVEKYFSQKTISKPFLAKFFYAKIVFRNILGQIKETKLGEKNLWSKKLTKNVFWSIRFLTENVSWRKYFLAESEINRKCVRPRMLP